MESVSSWDAKLYKSSFDGDIESLNDALAQGGRVTVRSPKGFTPLLVAANNGHTDICGLLLAHGSNVHDRSHQGSTPLLIAAYNGHTDTLVCPPHPVFTSCQQFDQDFTFQLWTGEGEGT